MVFSEYLKPGHFAETPSHEHVHRDVFTFAVTCRSNLIPMFVKVFVFAFNFYLLVVCFLSSVAGLSTNPQVGTLPILSTMSSCMFLDTKTSSKKSL